MKFKSFYACVMSKVNDWIWTLSEREESESEREKERERDTKE